MSLVVIITGLVLLVPDRDHARLHLFFPDVDWRHPGMEHHTPFLNYTGASGPQSISLEGWTLDLGELAEPGGTPGIPTEVLDLGTHLDWSVPNSWVTDLPPLAVQGRLTLPWPDAVKVEGTAEWVLARGAPLRRVTLTNQVVLRYEAPLPPSPWELLSLPSGPGGSTTLDPMRPVDRAGTVHISNLPSGPGPDLTFGDEGVHFQGYVNLLRRRLVDQLRPRPRVYLNEAPGFSPFNCMLAAAPLGG